MGRALLYILHFDPQKMAAARDFFFGGGGASCVALAMLSSPRYWRLTGTCM